MKAFERGEEIECNSLYNPKWTSTTAPAWSWNDFCYRIKPKPKQTVTIEKWLMKTHQANYETHFILEASREEIELHEKGAYDAKPLKLLDTYEVEL